jgi:NADH:ubiquinone oxidoreductase subunit 5 (subunit L)/multisubunit Na+/H+ antiporter MnhA subunit
MFFAEAAATHQVSILDTAAPYAAVLGSAFAVAYSIRFIHGVFFGPPPADLPRVVLAHPATVLAESRRPSVFIPVSTPGIGAPGHLFRTDGVVLLPLAPAAPDDLPTVAAVVARIDAALRAAPSNSEFVQ